MKRINAEKAGGLSPCTRPRNTRKDALSKANQWN